MGDEAAAEWKFMCMFNHHKASHITQDHQDMLINRIHMK